MALVDWSKLEKKTDTKPKAKGLVDWSKLETKKPAGLMDFQPIVSPVEPKIEPPPPKPVYDYGPLQPIDTSKPVNYDELPPDARKMYDKPVGPLGVTPFFMAGRLGTATMQAVARPLSVPANIVTAGIDFYANTPDKQKDLKTFASVLEKTFKEDKLLGDVLSELKPSYNRPDWLNALTWTIAEFVGDPAMWIGAKGASNAKRLAALSEADWKVIFTRAERKAFKEGIMPKLKGVADPEAEKLLQKFGVEQALKEKAAEVPIKPPKAKVAVAAAERADKVIGEKVPTWQQLAEKVGLKRPVKTGVTTPIQPDIETPIHDYLKSKISTAEEKAPKIPIKDKIKQTVEYLNTQFYNKYSAIDKYRNIAFKEAKEVGKVIPESADPVKAYNRFLGSHSIADHKITQELKPIIQPIGHADYKDFLGLAVNKRLINLEGVKPGVLEALNKDAIEKAAKEGKTFAPMTAQSLADEIAKITAKYGPEKVGVWEKQLDKLYDYEKGLLDQMYRGGLLTDEAYVRMKNMGGYVPFQRIMEEADEVAGRSASAGGSGKFDIRSQNIVKRIAGSERDIQDPIEAIIENTHKVEELVNRNEVAKATVSLALRSKTLHSLITREKTPMKLVAKQRLLAAADTTFFEELNQYVRKLGSPGLSTVKGKTITGKFGYYQPWDDAMYRYWASSRQTAAHETAHFLMTKHGLEDELLKATPVNKIKALRDELYNFSFSVGERGKRLNSPDERFSNAFGWFMENRAGAEEMLPTFTKYMEKALVNNPKFAPLLAIKPNPLKTTEKMTIDIFRPDRFKKEEGLMAVMSKGKPVFFRVPSDLWAATSGLTTNQLDFLQKGLGKVLTFPTRFLRTKATTYEPGFFLFNPIRDQVTAYLNSKYGYVPVIDAARGIWSYIKKDKWYDEFMRSGAEQSLLIASDRSATRSTINSMLDSRTEDFVRNYVKNPLNALQELAKLSEIGTRIGLFTRTRKGLKILGKKGGSLEEAMLEAREGTGNFQQIGQTMQYMNAVTAFVNARTQIAGKLFNTARTRPVETGIKLAPAVFTAIALYDWNNKFPEYKNIDQKIKDTYFIFMVSGNKYYKIPKGELNIATNAMEHSLDAIKREAKDIWTYARIMTLDIIADWSPIGVKSGLGAAITLTPDTVRPLAEILFNKDFFREKPIIPKGMENQPPEYQYNFYTTYLSKELSRIAVELDPENLMPALHSPAYMEKIVNGYVPMPTTFWRGLNSLLSEEDRKKLINLPVLSKFSGQIPEELDRWQKLKMQSDLLAQQKASATMKIRKDLTPEQKERGLMLIRQEIERIKAGRK